MLCHQHRHLISCQKLVGDSTDDDQLPVQSCHNVSCLVQEADRQDWLQQVHRTLQSLLRVIYLHYLHTPISVMRLEDCTQQLAVCCRECRLHVCRQISCLSSAQRPPDRLTEADATHLQTKACLSTSKHSQRDWHCNVPLRSRARYASRPKQDIFGFEVGLLASSEYMVKL